jgi:hypothetical protein
MENYIFWTFMLAVLAVLAAGAALFMRAYLGGTTPGALLFRPKTERRLEVVDHASVDNRRRLVLIRRDNVEHLLMTGGPVDVVIETGIAIPAPRAPEIPIAQEPVGGRRTPIFGRAKDLDPDAGTRDL